MNPHTHPTPPIYAFGRIYWMLIGPAALLILGALIASHGGGWFTAIDVAFLVGIAMLVVARWLEFQGGDPQTDSGQPATDADLQHYAIGAVIVGIVLWIVANVVGNHWLVS